MQVRSDAERFLGLLGCCCSGIGTHWCQIVSVESFTDLFVVQDHRTPFVCAMLVVVVLDNAVFFFAVHIDSRAHGKNRCVKTFAQHSPL